MFKYKLEKYIPIEKVEDFYILEDTNCKKYLLYTKGNINYCLDIKENGYIPKSGLMFAEIIEKNIKDKNVLDLGTGQLGILAIHSRMYGANNVDAVDIDDECIIWLNKIVTDNCIEKVNVLKSDFFDNLDCKKKYDVILSNPPQMPMISGKMHDSGGVDGRKYINLILKKADNF